MASNRVIRVLHIFGRMARGGAEMRTIDVMRNIDRDRFQFNFCTLSGQPGTLDDEIVEMGGEVYPCPLGIDFISKFRQLLRKQRFDVVHSHVHMFSGLIMKLAASENVSMRITHFRSMQDGSGNGLRRSVQRRIMRHWVDKYATDILAVSEGAMSNAWSKDWQSDKRCRVLYNGIDTSKYSGIAEHDAIIAEFGIPSDSRVLIHVGRADLPKNHIRLISIFNELLKHEPDAKLLLVGRFESEIGQMIKDKVAQLGISESVVFAGERADVPQLLKVSDLLIFPSLWEGLPGAVLESCATGTPVLASDLPSVVEISSYIPHVHYLSLEKSDADWAAAAGDLLHGPKSIREEMVTAFQNSVFEMNYCLDEYNKLYGRLS